MLQELTRDVMAGRDLTEEQAQDAIEFMLMDETPEVAIASFLSALSIKGETADEIAGFARVMREHVVRIRSDHEKTVDTAGTGGGLDTFNISTTAAFVIAGAGVAVAKHGNRAVTSRCGSADVLAALGVPLESSPEMAESCLNRTGIAFMFAPMFHPAMKRVASIRRQLGHRTIFNLLGPLTNPASAPFQVIGVFSPSLTEKMAQALSRLDCRRGWVVHSSDGLDELSPGAAARVSSSEGKQVRTFDFDPSAFCLSGDAVAKLRGGTPSENAARLVALLEGRETGLGRDIVVLNAAAGIHLAEGTGFSDSVEAAKESIDSGAALGKLRSLVGFYEKIGGSGR